MLDIQYFNLHGAGSDRRQQAKLLADYLRKVPANDMVSYSEIKESFGFDPQKSAGRRIMSEARGILRGKGICFDTLHNKGWKRLDDKTPSLFFERTMKSVHGRATRGLQDSANISFEKLSLEEKINVSAHRACLAMVASNSAPNAYIDVRSTLEKKVLGSNEYEGDLTLETITRIVQPELSPRQKQAGVSVKQQWH